MHTLAAILPYLIGVALVATVAVLFTGIISMSVGGRFNARYGNLLMRWRIALQGLAILLFAALVFLGR